MKTTKEIIERAIKLSAELEEMGYGAKSEPILALAERTAALFARLKSVKEAISPTYETILPKEDSIL